MVEHLTIALPEWRRYDFKEGRDDAQARAWEALKGDEARTTWTENADYEFWLHKYHPVLGQYNGVHQFFSPAEVPSDDSESYGNFDEKDIKEAKEMLGHMLMNVMNRRLYHTLEIFHTLAAGAFEDAYDPEAEPYASAQRFLNAFDVKQREQIGRDLLKPDVVEDEDWIGALAIALLPANEAVEKIEKIEQLSNGRKAAEKKKKKKEEEEEKERTELRYKTMTTKFLMQYHTTHKEDESFVYLFHVFYALSQILRKENKTGMKADVGGVDDDDEDDDSKGGNDGQDKAHDGDDDDLDSNEGREKEALRKGDKGKVRVKREAAPEAAPKAALKAKAVARGSKRPLGDASPAEELGRGKRPRKDQEVIESEASS